jgi:hypothetical protein
LRLSSSVKAKGEPSEADSQRRIAGQSVTCYLLVVLAITGAFTLSIIGVNREAMLCLSSERYVSACFGEEYC